MAKNYKYFTTYPEKMKKEAKKLGLKIPASELLLLDQLVVMELEEFPHLEVLLNAECRQVEVHVKTVAEADIAIEMNLEHTDYIGFSARVCRIPKELAKIAGQNILNGSFIDNYLKQQITLEDAGSFSEIVMKGQPWIKSRSKHALDDCLYYLCCMIEETNQVHNALRDKTKYPTYDLRIISYDDNKVQTIKAVREFAGCGLREAKDIVDAASTGSGVIHTGSAEEFYRLQMMLQKAGASSEIA